METGPFACLANAFEYSVRANKEDSRAIILQNDRQSDDFYEFFFRKLNRRCDAEFSWREVEFLSVFKFYKLFKLHRTTFGSEAYDPFSIIFRLQFLLWKFL